MKKKLTFKERSKIDSEIFTKYYRKAKKENAKDRRKTGR